MTENNQLNNLGQIPDIKNKKKFLNTTVYIILCVFLLIYILAWYFIGGFFKNIISEVLAKNVNVEYSSLSLRGFPFKFKIKVNDLKIVTESYGVTSTTEFENAYISYRFFSNKYHLNIDKMTFNSGDNEINIDFLGNKNVYFSLNKNKDLNKLIPNLVNIDFQKVVVSSKTGQYIDIDSPKFVLNNMIADNYINSAMSLNSNSIKTYRKSIEGKEKDAENLNISSDLSIIVEKDNEGKAKKQILKLNDFTMNNTTRKFGVSTSGDYNIDMETTLNSLSFLIKFKNINSMLSLNADNQNDMTKIAGLKAIFSIIPANEKDTEKDRYVFVEKKTTDNFIKVNGENVQNLILKLNYGANFGINQ